MSRSYKNSPVIKDNRKGSKWSKKRANRMFRRSCSVLELCSGKSAIHRKYSETWNIHDCVSRRTREEAEAEWEREELFIKNGMSAENHNIWHRRFTSRERFLNYWAKCMKRK